MNGTFYLRTQSLAMNTLFFLLICIRSLNLACPDSRVVVNFHVYLIHFRIFFCTRSITLRNFTKTYIPVEIVNLWTLEMTIYYK